MIDVAERRKQKDKESRNGPERSLRTDAACDPRESSEYDSVENEVQELMGDEIPAVDSIQQPDLQPAEHKAMLIVSPKEPVEARNLSESTRRFEEDDPLVSLGEIDRGSTDGGEVKQVEDGKSHNPQARQDDRQVAIDATNL
ncbi:MAG: hypothetical protein AAGC60_02355 [Acidobacteriota bacterium]